MKCIVIETSPERINAKPVTNEDGTPHVYATMAEARAELKANGYSYNRANQRYYINGTEYRAYIIREDSEEYADAITTATATAEEPEPNRTACAYADAAAARFCAAYTDTTGEIPYFEEAASVCKVARDEIAHEHRSTDDDRATVSAMVEAIADRAREVGRHRR